MKLEDRFWSKVDDSDPDGCWPWLASTDKDGYGFFSVNRRNKRAHRVAYELTYGPLDPEDVARHTCDNPPCCNPDHIVPGTFAQNTADMMERNRNRPGRYWEGRPAPHKSHLSDDDVRNIRRRRDEGESAVALADEYKATPETIRNIHQRRTRQYVTD